MSPRAVSMQHMISPPIVLPEGFFGVGVNTKAKGNRIEHEAMRLLESVGFKCCRSAASLGEWDIVGIGPDWFVVVQCKANRWPPKPERILLEKFDNPSNCIKLEWRRDDRKKPRVRQVSGKNSIPLGEIKGINKLLNEGRIHES